MASHHFSIRPLAGAVLLAGVAWASPARAQVTAAKGYTPPDDTPSIKVGATLFMDYTIQDEPKVTDAAGNDVTKSSFNVGRTYINVTGQINHIISFRITPDITKVTGSNSYVYRLKYAFVQFGLDDWMTKGSWVRFGQQQTPYIDYAEGLYRYRFQGPTFPDREGYLTSSDLGASFHYNIQDGYGDIHTGIYNGEGYGNVSDPNNEKTFQIRGTFRPLPKGDANLRGLGLTGFYQSDKYVKGADRNRGIFEVYFQHKYLNALWSYLSTTDQTLPTATKRDGKGWWTYVNPKYPIASKPGASIEVLYRHDQLEPDTSLADQKSKRDIFGIAYWFPHQGNVNTALMFDVDNTTFSHFAPGKDTQRNISIHGQVNF